MTAALSPAARRPTGTGGAGAWPPSTTGEGVEQPEAELDEARRRAVLFVLLASVATALLLFEADPGSLALPRGGASRVAVVVSLPALGLLLAGTATQRLPGELVERALWCVMAALLWTWDLDAAVRVTDATVHLHMLDVLQITSVLVVGSFLAFRRRRARVAAGAMIVLFACSSAIAAQRATPSEEAPYTAIVVVTLALMADGLSGSTQILRNHEARARATALLAFRDDLTGLLNRRGITPLLDGLRPGAGLLVVDIDRFKRVNDEHGHAVGDQVLRGVAASLCAAVRGHDEVARWGGEEFLVVVPTPGDAALAVVADRLRVAVASSPAVPAVTVSVGAARLGADETWEEALRHADAALYEAKAAGRDRVVEAPV